MWVPWFLLSLENFNLLVGVTRARTDFRKQLVVSEEERVYRERTLSKSSWRFEDPAVGHTTSEKSTRERHIARGFLSSSLTVTWYMESLQGL